MRALSRPPSLPMLVAPKPRQRGFLFACSFLLANGISQESSVRIGEHCIEVDEIATATRPALGASRVAVCLEGYGAAEFSTGAAAVTTLVGAGAAEAFALRRQR